MATLAECFPACNGVLLYVTACQQSDRAICYEYGELRLAKYYLYVFTWPPVLPEALPALPLVELPATFTCFIVREVCQLQSYLLSHYMQ